MPKKRKAWKTNQSGRSAHDQYFSMSYRMAHSAAWRSLSGRAVKVWVELRTRFNGTNNGAIYLSLDEGSRTLGLGKATVKRAFDELEAKGFIVKVTPGHWWGRQATEWRLTDTRCDGQNPTEEWKQWSASKSESRFRNEPVSAADGC